MKGFLRAQFAGEDVDQMLSPALEPDRGFTYQGTLCIGIAKVGCPKDKINSLHKLALCNINLVHEEKESIKEEENQSPKCGAMYLQVIW